MGKRRPHGETLSKPPRLTGETTAKHFEGFSESLRYPSELEVARGNSADDPSVNGDRRDFDLAGEEHLGPPAVRELLRDVPTELDIGPVHQTTINRQVISRQHVSGDVGKEGKGLLDSEAQFGDKEPMPAGGIRPRGVLEKITDQWKADVDRWLRAQPMLRKELARQVKLRGLARSCSEPAITKLLTPLAQGGPRQSRLARPVSIVTGVALPHDPDPAFSTLIDQLRRKSSEDPQYFRFVMDTLRGMLAPAVGAPASDLALTNTSAVSPNDRAGDAVDAEHEGTAPHREGGSRKLRPRKRRH